MLLWDHPIGIPKSPDYPIQPGLQVKFTTWYWTMLTGLSITGGGWPMTSILFGGSGDRLLFLISNLQFFFGIFAVFPIIGGAWSVTFHALYNKSTNQVFIGDPNYRKVLMYILESSTITHDMQLEAFMIYKEKGIECLLATPYSQLLPETVYDDPEPMPEPVLKDGVLFKANTLDPVKLYNGFWVTFIITILDLWVFI